MALTKFEKDMVIIQKLDDEPNDVGGLTAAELKAKFDEGGEAIKSYLNETLVPELDGGFDGSVPITRKINGYPLSDDIKLVKGDIGLGEVDNTSDADKPVSTAQQAAIDAKADKSNVLQKDNYEPYTPTQPYHPSTKEYADKILSDAVLGTIPDSSITPAKLDRQYAEFTGFKVLYNGGGN